MLKKIIIILFIALSFISMANAQNECPEEWQSYTTNKYFSSLQPGENEEFKPQADFLADLEATAVKRMLRNIRVAVNNLMLLQQYDIDEDLVLAHLENSGSKAGMGVNLINVKQSYNDYTHHGCVIAYIEKENAIKFYCDAIKNSHAKIQTVLQSATKHIESNNTDKARIELESIVPELVSNESALFLLKVFECNAETIETLNQAELKLKDEVKEKFKIIGPKLIVAIDCNVDLFGSQYWDIQENAKDWLASRGIGFTNDKAEADWILTIKSTTRKYNTISNGSQTTYYSYVDAEVILQKKGEAKPTYNQKLTIKGSFLKSYEEAAKVAYTDLNNKIEKILEANIK